MPEPKIEAKALIEGDLSLTDYLCALSEKDRDSRTGLPAWDREYWKLLRRAEQEGKKIILLNGPAPVELFYALDLFPLYLDLIPGRLLMDSALIAELIRLAETRANDALCSLHKSITGLVLSEKLGPGAAAYVGMPIPCDSARTACKETSGYLSLPVFQFDPPGLRRRKSTLSYLAMQLERLIEFLEEIAGKKLDWAAVKERIVLYNRAVRLAEDCRSLRKNRPCPLSSRRVLQNEMMNAMGPTEEMLSLLEAEKALCAQRAKEGLSPCPGGERHRIFMLHNLLFVYPRLTAWLEENYGAVTVSDGYDLADPVPFQNPDDREACLLQMAERMAAGASAHGTGLSGEELTAALDGAAAEYRPDVFLFLGSRGCRHFWAETKLISDSLQEKHGYPMLMLDMDNTDLRYKPMEELQAEIAEYMDTVVEG